MEFRESDFIEAPEELQSTYEEDDGGDIASKVLSLFGKNAGQSRTECMPKVTQFHTPVGGRVELHELLKCLDNKTQHSSLKKQLNRVEKREKVLDVPLSRHELDQVTRLVQYEKTVKDVSLWEPVIVKNRKAEQLKFPLVQPDLKLHQTLAQFVDNQHKPRTSLELEVAELLHLSQPLVEAVAKPLSKIEEAALKAMSLEEAKLKRAELQKNRMHAAFVASKLRLQGKIKSKKFHKIRRKERQKQKLKEVELMESNGTEEYQNWLHKAEKQRIQERMSLRHKGSSRYMQRQSRFGKYNMASRQAVQDMLQEGQTLTQRKPTADSDNEDELTSSDEELSQRHGDSDQDNNKHCDPLQDLSRQRLALDNQDEESDSNEEEWHEAIDPTLTKKQQTTKRQMRQRKGNEKKQKALPSAMIDPTQFMKCERDLSSTAGASSVSIEDDADTRIRVAQAFADDDVMAEFSVEKQNIVERDKPKDIDLRLPGWGDWSGPGITQSKNRKKRFIIKAPQGAVRKDCELGNVILKESKNTAVAKHQVNSLPYPFKNVIDYERRIQQPIGRMWNNVATFKKCVKPKIVTKLGKIIEPIDKSETFKKPSFDVAPVKCDRKSKCK